MAATKQEDKNPVETLMVGVIPVMMDILTGSLWEKDETEIKNAQENLLSVLSGLKSVAKNFDEALIVRRKGNPDTLKSVEYFRKPREKKEGTTTELVDLFKVK